MAGLNLAQGWNHLGALSHGDGATWVEDASRKSLTGEGQTPAARGSGGGNSTWIGRDAMLVLPMKVAALSPATTASHWPSLRSDFFRSLSRRATERALRRC